MNWTSESRCSKNYLMIDLIRLMHFLKINNMPQRLNSFLGSTLRYASSPPATPVRNVCQGWHLFPKESYSWNLLFRFWYSHSPSLRLLKSSAVLRIAANWLTSERTPIAPRRTGTLWILFFRRWATSFPIIHRRSRQLRALLLPSMAIARLGARSKRLKLFTPHASDEGASNALGERVSIHCNWECAVHGDWSGSAPRLIKPWLEQTAIRVQGTSAEVWLPPVRGTAEWCGELGSCTWFFTHRGKTPRSNARSAIKPRSVRLPPR